MNRTKLVAVAAVVPMLWALPAVAQEYSERIALAVGGFSPSGPAPIGTYLSVNYGGRVSETLRVGAEAAWYRREYNSRYLLVGDANTGSGAIIESVSTTNLLPILGTADYFIPYRRGIEFHLGGGVGLDWARTKHYPVALAFGSQIPPGTVPREFTRNATGLGWMVRAGITTRPGRTVGAVFLEAFYKGSTIGGEENFRAGDGADTETRYSGPGFRVGFRF